MTSRLAAENYVVVGVTLAVITISCQILFLPFLFSEIDAIRNEFDTEIREALVIFESSYEKLARFQLKSSSIRKQREAVKNMVADHTSTGPADHRVQAEAAKTHHARVPLSGTSGSPPGSSQFSPELRKLAREAPTPTDVTDYDMDDDVESEYEDIDPPPTAQGAQVLTVAPTVAGVTVEAAPPGVLHDGAATAAPGAGGLPMCPLEENRCPPGLAGPPGLRGTPGLNGIDGNDGTPGTDAMDELTPSYPIFCISCPAGPDGKPGVPGPTGKPGLTGAPGIPGPNGKNGQPGAPGGYGSPGKQGTMGIRGLSGGQGQDGVVLLNTKGPKGPPGKAGPDGQPGEDGTNNNTPGPVGEVGRVGESGLQGAGGLYGKRGETGEAGGMGMGSEECTCDNLMKKAIELAENSAYTAVEAQAQSQQVVDAPTIPPGKLLPPEIRRTPQKASSLAAAGLPTLEELRNNYEFARQPQTFAQEDGAVKFAVAPSEVENSEDGGEVLHSGSVQKEEVAAENSVAHRSPIAMKPELVDTAEFETEVFESEIDSDPETLTDTADSQFASDTESLHVTRPALFAPPRAHFPHQLNPSLSENSAKSEIVNLKSPKQLPRVNGDSRKKPVEGESTKKTRSEGKSGMGGISRLRKVNRHPAFRVFATSDDFVNLDEGEKPFRVEKEIARESEKKIINNSRKKEIRRSPKKLRRKTKHGKVEKKLRRVHLTPSKKLVYAHRQNTNILENIAKSLGLIEQRPEEVKPKIMNRVHVP